MRTREFWVFLALILLVFGVGQGWALVIEDFEDVSDWMVEVGPGALDGSIGTDAGQAQGGSFAGALFYEHSTAQSWDFVFYTLDLSAAPLDMSDPDLRLEFDIKAPDDPNMFIQIRLVGDPNGATFREINLGEGDGLWHHVSMDYHAWSDYGTNPDLSGIDAIQIRTIGDISTAYTTGTIYLDNLELNVVSPEDALIVEDFEDLSDWSVSVGPGAIGASLSYDAGGVQVGAYAGAFHYQLSSAVGFDFVNFEKWVNLDLSAADSLDFYFNAPNDPDMFIVMRLFDVTWKFLEYTFHTGRDGQWHQWSLAIPEGFADYGNAPDLSQIRFIRIQANGDGSTKATSSTFYMDHMTLGYNCSGLLHDSNNDCVVDLLDLVEFIEEWLECGWNVASQCP